MKKLLVIAVAYLTLGVAAPVLAETSVTSAPAAADETQLVIESGKKAGPTESPWTRMTLGACILIGLIATGYYGVGKLNRKANQGSNQFELKTLARHHMGPKKYLAVVKVAGETMLIGVTDHHIGLVKSLSILDEDVQNGAFEDLITAPPAQDEFSMSKVRDVFKHSKPRES